MWFSTLRLARRFSTYFTKEHEWIRITKPNMGLVGITDHAQSQLGEIVFVEFPEVNQKFKAGDTLGSLESVKTVADVYSPFAGTVLEVNSSLSQTPETINNSPEEDGWLVSMELDDATELEKLLSREEYDKFVEEEAH